MRLLGILSATDLQVVRPQIFVQLLIRLGLATSVVHRILFLHNVIGNKKIMAMTLIIVHSQF